MALGHVLRLPGAVRLTVAGRTDSGVHARGQVAHADVPAEAWADPWACGAAPPIACAAAGHPGARPGPAPDGFDARFSPLWRRYAYRICDDPAQADPLRRRDTLWNPRPLDLGAMNEAAASLLGEHDFAAFCRKREGATTIRALRRLDWERDPEVWPLAAWWPTRSATTWSAHSSARCSPSARAPARRPGPPRC